MKSRPAPPLPSCGEQGVPAGLRPRPRPWEEPSQPPGPRTPGKAQGRASRSPAWGSTETARPSCQRVAAGVLSGPPSPHTHPAQAQGLLLAWTASLLAPASTSPGLWLAARQCLQLEGARGGLLTDGPGPQPPTPASALVLKGCRRAGPVGLPPHEEVRGRGVVHPDSGSTHSVWQRKAGSRQGTALGVYGLSHQPLKQRKVQTWFVEQDLAAALSGPHRPQAQGRPLGQPGASAHQCGLRERRCGGAWRLSSLAPPPGPSPTPTAAGPHRRAGGKHARLRRASGAQRQPCCSLDPGHVAKGPEHTMSPRT